METQKSYEKVFTFRKNSSIIIIRIKGENNSHC